MRSVWRMVDMGSVSDGYHTFDELYEQRHTLFAALLHMNSFFSFKTWRDDKGEKWDGWFIAGMNTMGTHLPMS